MRTLQRLCLVLVALLGGLGLRSTASASPLLAAPAAAPLALSAEDAPADEEGGWMDTVDSAMGQVNGVIASVFFFDVWFWDGGTELDAQGNEVQKPDVVFPLAVMWLVLGAIFFTFRMGFINLRGFWHAIRITKGDYDNPEDEGEVSHFQALASALSATVGLGNIAGVAIAVSVGGPGATFWMIAAGFLGMSSKFVECTLGQKYRQVRPDGRVMGGAMYYLSNGLKELGLGPLGKVLAMFFAILCIGGSFGGGNTFQVNQSLNALQEIVPFLGENRWVYGAVMTALVGIVILGGIKRIASTAEKIVPLMCGIYVLACLWVLVSNAGHIGTAFGEILSGAFSPDAAYGGFIGVLVQGFKRAAFSNEAGVGSAAIAHSAAKTEYPVQEGIVALLEPFIDTIVVCTMTALVIVITGAYDRGNAEFLPYIESANGAGLTSQAFATVIDWFPMVLGVAVTLFAFSTMISWSYYGERCWAYVFGDGSSTVYRVLFLTFTFLGSIITAQQVLDFGDLMILGMAFPNVLGVILLSGGVKRDLDAYWAKLKSGEVKSY
jgi:AGCS family alanine or glycine:cation symporter